MKGNSMTDPYLGDSACILRLVAEYTQHNSVVVAYDFDDTVYDFHKKGRTYTKLIEILRRAKEAGCYLIVWTGNEDTELVTDYLDSHDIPYDAVNQNPPFMASKMARKIYANIYLDDRAGLSAAYHHLECMLDLVNPQA